MWLMLNCTSEGCKPPSARSGPAMTVLGDNLYLHGGLDEADLRFTNDLFVLDLETHTWRLLPEEGDSVMQRDFHSAVAVNGRIVVFGGRSEN